MVLEMRSPLLILLPLYVGYARRHLDRVAAAVA